MFEQQNNIVGKSLLLYKAMVYDFLQQEIVGSRKIEMSPCVLTRVFAHFVCTYQKLQESYERSLMLS